MLSLVLTQFVIFTVLRVISYNRLTRSNVYLCTGGCVSGLFIAQAVHTPVITYGIVVQTLRLPLSIFMALSIMTHKTAPAARAVVYFHYRMVQGRLPGQVGVPAGGGGGRFGGQVGTQEGAPRGSRTPGLQLGPRGDIVGSPAPAAPASSAPGPAAGCCIAAICSEVTQKRRSASVSQGEPHS